MRGLAGTQLGKFIRHVLLSGVVRAAHPLVVRHVIRFKSKSPVALPAQLARAG